MQIYLTGRAERAAWYCAISSLLPFAPISQRRYLLYRLVPHNMKYILYLSTRYWPVACRHGLHAINSHGLRTGHSFYIWLRYALLKVPGNTLRSNIYAFFILLLLIFLCVSLII